MYTGNESPTLNYCNGRHGLLYRAIATGTGGLTKMGQTTSKDCTNDVPDFIASYHAKQG